MPGPVGLGKTEIQVTPTADLPSGLKVIDAEDFVFTKELFNKVNQNWTLSATVAGAAANTLVSLPGDISSLVLVLQLSGGGAVTWISSSDITVENNKLKFVTDQTGNTFVVFYKPVLDVLPFVLNGKINSWR